ncbi:MAG: DUF2164 domain-containing protein [Bacillota bacterium]
MSKTETRKIKISKEEEKLAIEEIIQFFEKERDEEIGNIESMMLLEFFMEKIGPSIYNQAIADAQKYMSNKVEDLYGLMF